MTTYNFAGTFVKRDAPDFDAVVASAYGVSPRPLCMCRPKGVEMYIARAGERYIVKRMPDSGGAHQLACPSYESPFELSGKGEVMGTAIQTNPSDGTTALKFDFSMSRKGTAGRGPAAGAQIADHVRTDGAKLTLRGVLHFLWSEAGFNKWFPAMAGKRSWFVIRKHLMAAAQDKLVKNAPLSDLLYMPESFTVENKEAIARRRAALFKEAVKSDSGARQFMLLVAEVKEIGDARFGKKLIVKHVPDCAFLLHEDIAKRLAARFADELEMWSAMSDVRLIVLATFSVSANGIPAMEAMTLMLTTEQWIPIENGADKSLVDRLVVEKRQFEKGLRYNLASEKVIASAILVDTPAPVALYVAPANPPANFGAELDSLKRDSALASWTWDASAGDMPELPPFESLLKPLAG
ncbi:hypothetical protein AAKU55_003086 [Oxalobacteraceae bacterium GrIS 1.11]